MTENEYNFLYTELSNGGEHNKGKDRYQYTMVGEACFNMLYRHQEQINKLEGDIVECGVWRGGMSIFLSKLFEQKTMWAVDSYEGFQDPLTAKYSFPNDPHNPSDRYMSCSLETVKDNFAKFNCLDENRIKFLKGYVVDTLNPSTCPIEKISVLRVDVDAYSATTEVLDYLYPKVVSGGYIIFDDMNIDSAAHAIDDFFKRENLNRDMYNLITHTVDGVPQFIEKPFIFSNMDNRGGPGTFFIKP